MVCTHSLVDIGCKAKDNKLQSTVLEKLGNKGTLRGTHGSLWQEEIDDISLEHWGRELKGKVLGM